MTVVNFVVVGIGGCLGVVARYGVSLLAQRYMVAWPLGTFLVNIGGCFVIGVVTHLSNRTTVLTPEMRLFLATGFCGGFTTMSSFVYEVMQMVRDQEYYYAAWYAGGTLVGSYVAFVAGLMALNMVSAVMRALWS